MVTRRGELYALVGTTAALTVCFVLLLAAGDRIGSWNRSAARSLPATYATFVVPVVLMLVGLTVILQFPLFGYFLGVFILICFSFPFGGASGHGWNLPGFLLS
ncbi:MAG: hypothetical protein JW929_04440 [Anaerolineales bacterium]|nr:hypothetical protein [Anaerolineales bacterium]